MLVKIHALLIHY